MKPLLVWFCEGCKEVTRFEPQTRRHYDCPEAVPSTALPEWQAAGLFPLVVS